MSAIRLKTFSGRSILSIVLFRLTLDLLNENRPHLEFQRERQTEKLRIHLSFEKYLREPIHQLLLFFIRLGMFQVMLLFWLK